MGLLPKQFEYGMMALEDMHSGHPGRLFSVRELSEARGVPFDVMSKTMQRMGRAGILRSVKGVNGGYQLIRDLTDVSVMDVINAVMGGAGCVKCRVDGRDCAREPTCTMTQAMAYLDEKLNAVYRSTSVLELLEVAKPSLQGIPVV